MASAPTPPHTELQPGDTFTAVARGIAAQDARTVVELCGYTHPLFAGDAPPRMLPGQIVLALMAGALESSGRMGADVMALVGMDDVAFRAPLAPGDPLDVEVVVAGREPTSRGDRDVLELDLRATSAGTEVATARARFLLRRPT